jgi:hypothetical protein
MAIGIFQQLQEQIRSDERILLYAAAVAVGVIVSFLTWCIQPDPEAAARFTVPEPDPCRRDWKGKILHNLTIKVCTPFHYREAHKLKLVSSQVPPRYNVIVQPQANC